jgi:hypothetical protein
MPESKNNFTKSKMNKDLDDRLLPNGEYRDALNINIAKSEGSKMGAIENIKSNAIPYLTNLNLSVATESIGMFIDDSKDRVFWFLTDNVDYNSIVMFDQKTNSVTTLVKGIFLKFRKSNLITAVNVLGDLLFWNDDVNQPRRINIVTALSNNNYYYKEEHISVARFAPIDPPLLLQPNGTSSMSKVNDSISVARADFLEDKFVRLSYRYKFVDNEYSVIAPFSQICFVPLESGILNLGRQNEVVLSAEMPLMKNQINNIDIYIRLPARNVVRDYQIKGIEILLKESDSLTVKSVDFVNLTNRTDSSSDLLKYTYKGNNPYKVLPESQLLRISDNIPLRAKAQEVAGNRLMMGNYEQNHPIPNISYAITQTDKPVELIAEYPNHSVKQRRDYQVGVVFQDKFGRQSPVILPQQSQRASIYVKSEPNRGIDWKGKCLNMVFQTLIPNPYSVKSVYHLDSSSISTSLNNPTTLIITNLDLSGVLTPGKYLKSNAYDHTLILSSEFIDGETAVVCQYPINSHYNGLVGADTEPFVELPYYTLPADGIWHSYKIVVKQNQQDYYNVYTQGGRNLFGKTYLSLHGDNINKLPIDPTGEVRQTGISPCNVNIYPKVLFVDDTPGVFKTVQNDPLTDDKAFSVIGIGTAREQNLVLTPGASDIHPWVYERYKNHLVAEINDPNLRYGIVRTTNDPDVPTLNMSVFETRAFKSELDIFWETSTTGLVEDLNYSIGLEPAYPIGLDFGGVTSFSESLNSGDFVPGLQFSAIPTPSNTITGFSIVSVKNEDEEDLTGLFEVFFDDSDHLLKLNTAQYYRSGQVSDLRKQKYFLEVEIQDTGGISATETITLTLENSTPIITFPSASGTSITTIPNIQPNDIILRVVTENGSASEVDKFKDIVYSLTGPDAGTFTINQFGDLILSSALNIAQTYNVTVVAKDSNGLTGNLATSRTLAIQRGAGSNQFFIEVSYGVYNGFSDLDCPNIPLFPGVLSSTYDNFSSWRDSGFSGGTLLKPNNEPVEAGNYLLRGETGVYITVGAGGQITSTQGECDTN